VRQNVHLLLQLRIVFSACKSRMHILHSECAVYCYKYVYYLLLLDVHIGILKNIFNCYLLPILKRSIELFESTTCFNLEVSLYCKCEKQY